MCSTIVTNIIVIVNFSVIIQIVAALKYVILPKNENIFSPCENMKKENSIDNFLDFSNLNNNFFENSSVYINGYAVISKDIGKEMNPVSIQVFRKNRDTWVSTVYNMKRDDACLNLYDKSELWNKYMKDIPEEEQTCPLKKGTKLYFDVITDLQMDLPDPRLAGEYKIQIMITFTGINEVLCGNILADVYRE